MKTISLVLAMMMIGCGGDVVRDLEPCDAGADVVVDAAPACMRDGGPFPNDPACHDVGGRQLPDGTSCPCGICFGGECY